MSDPVLNYCVSCVINFICKDAAEHLISSWNCHRIPGPLATRRNQILPEPLIPTTPKVVQMYGELGGSLSRESSFGWDPLVINEEAYQNRVARFLLLGPTGRPIFSDVVHGKKDRLRRAIEYFYQLTVTLSQ